MASRESALGEEERTRTLLSATVTDKESCVALPEGEMREHAMRHNPFHRPNNLPFLLRCALQKLHCSMLTVLYGEVAAAGTVCGWGSA